MGSNNNSVITLRADSEAGKNLQKRLLDEQTLTAIDRLLFRIDTLEKAVESLTLIMQQGPGMVAMAGDMVDEAYRQADANGISVDTRLKNALVIAEKLTTSEMTKKLEDAISFTNQLPGLMAMTVDMIDESMKEAVTSGFDPKVLADTAKTANIALTNAKAEPPAKVGGLFGIFKLLRDPDRQKGLGFFMNFLKHFGRNI